MKKLSVQAFAISSSVTVLLMHILGYLMMYLFFRTDETWALIYPLMHPGGEWLTVSGFFIGLIEAIIFGYLVGLVLSGAYNMFLKE